MARGPYEDRCSQEQERMRGIKSMQVYSWKRMECTWQIGIGSLSLILVINMQFV